MVVGDGEGGDGAGAVREGFFGVADGVEDGFFRMEGKEARGVVFGGEGGGGEFAGGGVEVRAVDAFGIATAGADEDWGGGEREDEEAEREVEQMAHWVKTVNGRWMFRRVRSGVGDSPLRVKQSGALVTYRVKIS